MNRFDSFVVLLNARPLAWTVSLGVAVYLAAFFMTVLAMATRVSPLFEIGFVLSGSLVMAYHWIMSRFLTGSSLSQFVQLSLGLALILMTMAINGAVIHHKAYEWINNLIY